jgi:hypothetical protein
MAHTKPNPLRTKASHYLDRVASLLPRPPLPCFMAFYLINTSFISHAVYRLPSRALTTTTFPDEENFRHYRGIFEYLRSMVYREEIRLDKIIDDLQDYVTYTLEHGIPRPPVHPNPHLIPIASTTSCLKSLTAAAAMMMMTTPFPTLPNFLGGA